VGTSLSALKSGGKNTENPYPWRYSSDEPWPAEQKNTENKILIINRL
jgi:rRNA maturation protein Nop10